MRYYIRGAGTEWHRELIWDMTFRTYGSDDPCELTTIICDQRQEEATGWFPYQPDYYNGQSFDPNRPYLYAVEGYFSPNTALDGEFTVEIWRHTPGLPTNYTDPRLGTEPLGTETITHIETGAQPNCWVRWDFSPAIDVSEYYYSANLQPLMILWKTPNVGPGTTYSDLDPYTSGSRYWITNTAGEESTWFWTRYMGDDMMFRTYGSYGAPWVCGGAGTVYLTGDISGPAGAPDCYVNLYDLAVISSTWLDCTDPQQSRCDEFWGVS